MDTTFHWLGRFPLAVDLADTVRVVGPDEVDLLTDDDALAAWVELEQHRFPVVRAARGRLREVRGLRATVRDLLFAAAEGRDLPAPAQEAVNAASARSPTFPVLAAGDVRHEEPNPDRFDRFCAAVARSTIDVVTGTAREQLAVCRGPSCGMLFLRADRRQRWCSPACGNRARVARHAARRRATTDLA